MTTAPADSKRRALGKGLDSLLPRVQAAASPVPAQSAAAAEGAGDKPREVALDLIEKNPYQTRGFMDDAELAELAKSIEANGVLQPILVRPLAGGRFQLIAGERRWRASALAQRKTIPVLVRQVSDEQAMEITIVENLQRADLNPLEQAKAFERLQREFHMTQEQMAERTGKERASIANFMRLLKLPVSVQALVEAKELSFGHAKVLLSLQGHPAQESAAFKATSLSVRQTEALVQSILNPEKVVKEAKPEKPVDPNVREVAETLQRALGLKVTIEDKRGRGRVIIEYAKLEDFDGLLEKLA